MCQLRTAVPWLVGFSLLAFVALQIAAKEAMLTSKRQGHDKQRAESQQHNEMLMELSQTIGDLEGKTDAGG